MAVVHHHKGGIIHPEGRGPVLVLAAFLLAGILWAARRAGGRFPVRVTLLSLGFFALIAQFFRYPGSTTPAESDLVVAPAYGRVVHLGAEPEPEILGDTRLRVSIFLSLFNPHLTRSPIGGRVTYQRYHPGRYLVALHPKASTLNERSSVLIEHSSGTSVLVRQIAGLVARRICSYTRVGSRLTAGEEMGFIKLGSRVDVFLPLDATVLVRAGQHVSAGQTPLARLHTSAE